jgi:uncharacterized protein
VEDPYLPRLIDRFLHDLFRELPALMVVGPRATGKTTTAARHAASVVRLDRADDAAPFRADPDAALGALPEPILIDEWQTVPSVLGAVKRAVDQDFRAGRFILTGSVRDKLTAAAWPGTGRVVQVAMTGLTEREIIGSLEARPFLDRIADDDLDGSPAGDAPDIRGYLDRALRGGFPEPALQLSPAARAEWLEGYVEQLVTRDVELVDAGRDPVRLRRYFEAYTLNTAGVADDRTLYEAAGVSSKTADAYNRLLQNLFVVDSVPGWTGNRLKRLIRAPKRYLVDPALAVGSLRIDARSALFDGSLFGRLIETFVVAQLRAELPLSETRPRLYHLRQQAGRHEIDLIAELAGHRIIGIEIKAAAAVRPDDARHLRWLRDELGDRFVRGVILHTGPRMYELDERIVAAPICTIWS